MEKKVVFERTEKPNESHRAKMREIFKNQKVLRNWAWFLRFFCGFIIVVFVLLSSELVDQIGSVFGLTPFLAVIAAGLILLIVLIPVLVLTRFIYCFCDLSLTNMYMVCQNEDLYNIVAKKLEDGKDTENQDDSEN